MAKRPMFQRDEPWKLKNPSDIMVLICYVLKTVKKKIPTSIVIASLEGEGIADYFDIASALAKLREVKCIEIVTEENEDYAVLTELGWESSTQLETSVSVFVRKKAAKAALKALYRLKTEHENRVEIKKEGDSVFITCDILDGDKLLMSQTVRCGDVYQAERIRDQFLATPSLIYRGTLALLIGDIDSIGGLSAFMDRPIEEFD